MTDMVTRVARALWNAAEVGEFDAQPESTKSLYMHGASAAIEAMPTWQPMSYAPRDRPILLDLSYYYDHDKTPTEVYLVGEYVESDNDYVWDTGDEVFRQGAPSAWMDIPKTKIRRDAPIFVESKVPPKRLRLRKEHTDKSARRGEEREKVG